MAEASDRAQQALDDLEREVLRASRVIDELRRENLALRSRIDEFETGLAPQGEVASRLDAQRERFVSEREAIAERLKTIVGKFQWLEGEAT
jgi:uncharacterized coiled-coil DUF342 family protein